MRTPLCICLLTLSLHIHAQDSLKQKAKRIREYEKAIQLSLFPGISTNGIYSGSYYNNFSFNLFGGLSAGNHIFEAGLISNVNLKKSTGIQLAGLANIVGTNAFVNLTLSEERAMIHDGFESNDKGIQIAGFLNYVRDHAAGIQAAGVMNVVGVDFSGIQLSGIGNSAGGYTEGLQLAGIYNIGHKSMAGFQLSALFNHTDGELSGTQIGLINKARRIKGRKSTPPTRSRGFQLGALNFSRAMDGLQIGVINFGGDARGVQIGLINFFKKYGSKEKVRMGTPIALLNFGSRGSVKRAYYNELFVTNVEFTTGNCVNCSYVLNSEMPFDDRFQQFNQNALIAGYNPVQKTWGFGYGFQRMLYYKASVMPNRANRKYFIDYGISFIHLNREMKVDDHFNLVNRLHLDYGKRIRSAYLIFGIAINYFLFEEEDQDVYKINSARIATGKMMKWNSELWPGYRVGVQF